MLDVVLGTVVLITQDAHPIQLLSSIRVRSRIATGPRGRRGHKYDSMSVGKGVKYPMHVL